MGLTVHTKANEAEHYYNARREREFHRAYYWDADIGFVARERKLVPAYTNRRIIVRRTPGSHRQRQNGIRSSVKSGDGNNDSKPEPEPDRSIQQYYRYYLPHLHFTRFTTSHYLRARALYSNRVKNKSCIKTNIALANPDGPEFKAFMLRTCISRTDSAKSACWLALTKLKNIGRTIDYRGAKQYVSAEINKFERNNYERGVKMPECDRMSRALDSDSELPPIERGAMTIDESKLAPCFRNGENDDDDDDEAVDEAVESKVREAQKKKEPKRWAMQLIHHHDRYYAFSPDQITDRINEIIEHEYRISLVMRLKAAVKPRDREILELRFEKGMKIREIAEHLARSRADIYAAIKRMRPLLRDARERAEWELEHSILEKGTGDAPVVLDKTGQLGWDLGAEVQP